MKRALILVLLLSGCSLFGGGSKPTTPAAHLSTGDSGTIATSVPAVPTPEDTSFSAQFTVLLNQYRQAQGVQPVAEDGLLDSYALKHSQDMAARKVMDHANLTSDFHYINRQHCDQNVAWNYLTPQSLFNAWKASPAHNTNMLDVRVTTAGTAIVDGYATLWVCTKP